MLIEGMISLLTIRSGGLATRDPQWGVGGLHVLQMTELQVLDTFCLNAAHFTPASNSGRNKLTWRPTTWLPGPGWSDD